MTRLASTALLAGCLLPGQVQAEICVSQNAQTQWGVPFESCQVFDLIRQGLFSYPFPPMQAYQELGGDTGGPWVSHWITIGPENVSTKTFEKSSVTQLEEAVRDTVCRSRDLSEFVRFGGRASFDIQVQMTTRSTQETAERITLTTFWVDTCEAP